MKVDLLAGVDLGLAIERQVIAILADQNMSQKARPTAPAGDGTRRQVCLDEGFAAVAGHARTYDLAYNEVARHVIQLLGHILAKLTQLATAVATGLARRQNRLLALEVLGQGRTVVATLALVRVFFLGWFFGGIGRGLVLGRGFDLGVLLQVQRQLLRGLGFGAKAGLAMPVESDMLEIGYAGPSAR